MDKYNNMDLRLCFDLLILFVPLLLCSLLFTVRLVWRCVARCGSLRHTCALSVRLSRVTVSLSVEWVSVLTPSLRVHTCTCGHSFDVRSSSFLVVYTHSLCVLNDRCASHVMCAVPFRAPGWSGGMSCHRHWRRLERHTAGRSSTSGGEDVLAVL